MSKLLSRYLQAQEGVQEGQTKPDLDNLKEENKVTKVDDTADNLPKTKAEWRIGRDKAGLTNWVKLSLIAIIFLAVLYGAVQYGKHSERSITWFSELMERTQGRKQYFMEFEVLCSNGKDLGRLQVDFNLSNGKLRVVRNDSKLEPNCVLDPVKK